MIVKCNKIDCDIIECTHTETYPSQDDCGLDCYDGCHCVRVDQELVNAAVRAVAYKRNFLHYLNGGK